MLSWRIAKLMESVKQYRILNAVSVAAAVAIRRLRKIETDSTGQ
jgi:hypothetical protein